MGCALAERPRPELKQRSNIFEGRQCAHCEAMDSSVARLPSNSVTTAAADRGCHLLRRSASAGRKPQSLPQPRQQDEARRLRRTRLVARKPVHSCTMNAPPSPTPSSAKAHLERRRHCGSRTEARAGSDDRHKHVVAQRRARSQRRLHAFTQRAHLGDRRWGTARFRRLTKQP